MMPRRSSRGGNHGSRYVSRDDDGSTENKLMRIFCSVFAQCRFRNEQGFDVRTDDE